jgi:hypothetical protein
MKKTGSVLILFLLAVAAGYPADKKTTKIELNMNTVVNSNVAGIGWNIGPQWIPLDKTSPEFTQFFDALKDTGQSISRVLLYLYEWEGKWKDGKFVPENDDDDPYTKPQEIFNQDNKSFVWNSDQGFDSRFITVLDFYEQNGVAVNISNCDALTKPWIEKEKYKRARKSGEPPVTYEEYLRDAEEFGENVAVVVYYLKTGANHGKGYDCIKYYSLWNEPSGAVYSYDFLHVDYPGPMNLIHKTVREHLAFYDKEMGTDVSKQVLCSGIEGFPFSRHCPAAGHPDSQWNDMMLNGVLQYKEPPDETDGEITNWPDAGPYMDIIALHDYWGTFEYDKNNPSLKNSGPMSETLLKGKVYPVIQQVKEYASLTKTPVKPVYVNELGSYLYSGEQGSATYVHSLYVVEAAIKG